MGVTNIRTNSTVPTAWFTLMFQDTKKLNEEKSLQKGIHKRSIDNELKKVDKLDRNNLLQYRTDKSKTDRVPLVLIYSKGLPHAREIIKKNNRCVSVDFVYKSVFILPCSIIAKTSKNYNFSVEYLKST
jgi:hypothetical protein